MTAFKLTPAIHRNLDTLWAKIQRLHLRAEHAAGPDAAPRLPPELTDAIIDHLHGDRAALAACALVCTAFLNRSFHNLYRTVGMRDTRRFQRFLAFLPASTLRRYVAVLRLGNGGTDAGDAAAANRLHVDVAALAGVLEACPALELLELSCLTWVPGGDTAAGAPAPAPAPRAIEHLVLDDVRSSDSGMHLALHELAPLLRLFGAVARLSLGSFHGHVPGPSPGAPRLEGARLRALAVENLTARADAFNAPLLQLLRATGSAQTLKVVHVDAVDEATLVALGRLLRDAQAAVAVLQVDVMSLGPPHTREYIPEDLCRALDIPFNLAGCTSLRTLRFWINMSDGLGRVGMWHWRFFFAFLADAVASLPNVEHLVICISLGRNAKDTVLHAQEIDWAKLEHLLRQFPRLAYIGFGTPSPRKRTDDLRSIDNKLWKIAKKRLPVLYANRVLRWKNTYTT